MTSFVVGDDLAHASAYGAMLIVGITRLQGSDFDSDIRALTAAINEVPTHNVNSALF